MWKLANTSSTSSRLLQNGLTQGLLGHSLMASNPSGILARNYLRPGTAGNNLNNNKVNIPLRKPAPKKEVNPKTNTFKKDFKFMNNLSKKEVDQKVKNENRIGAKNMEMWKEYRAIDPRVIRPVDGNEFFVAGTYINVTDVFPKIDTEEFRRRAQENLSKLDLFNLSLKRINNHLFFIRKPFKIHIDEVEYNEDEEIDNWIKKSDQIPLEYRVVFDEEEKDVQLLYNFRICQLKKSNQTKITFSCNHTVSDGRTAFTILEILHQIVNGETIEKNDDQLSNFGGCERFKPVSDDFKLPPKCWSEIPECELYPKMQPPYQCTMTHKVFDYKPVEKFIRENKLSLQAMLMTMMTRTTRRYNNLPKEFPLWNTTPCDTRTSPFATEEFKKRKFFCNVSGVYVKLIGQPTLMEDLKYCKAQLKATMKNGDDVHQLISCSDVIDPKTFKFVPKGRFPDTNMQALVNSSNIGKVNAKAPLLWPSNPPMMPYFVFAYSYHTDDRLMISFYSPINFDKKYMDILYEEMNTIFNPEKIAEN